jgi:hypothetical protein
MVQRRFIISTLIQLVGLAAAAVGIAMVYLPAGLIAAGASLVVVGYASGVDPSAKADA